MPDLQPDDYNALLPEVRANPFPYWEVLRERAPVHPMAPGVPIYVVTRFEDVESVLHNTDDFSSVAIGPLLQGGAGIDTNVGALAGHRIFDSPMMISVDAPDHTRLRGLVNRGFTPRRIAELEGRIREIASSLLDPVVHQGEMDFMTDYAIPLPVKVIAELLGVESDRVDEFKAWSDAIAIGLSGTAGEYSREDIRSAADEMCEYFDRVAAERRASPQDDLISVLVRAEEGEALDTGEVISFILLLLVAGNETTTNLLGNATRALLAHPGQMEKVVADPALIPQMVEEALRYDSPIQGLPRRPLRDVEIAGVPIEAGTFLMLLFSSANRDEAQFPDADRFDIFREPQGHLAFGHGTHFCLGASLARLEARIAFETVFARCPGLRSNGEIEMIDSILLRGPKSMPLAFDTA